MIETRYTTLFSVPTSDHKRFSEAVNKEIQDGWEPIGGVTVHIGQTADTFMQAMIRRIQ